MQPFYFGTSQQQLFGIYHAPEARTARQSAIVLCQPLGHEYLRAHRAFRNLAVSLAGQGFHVLRFDYFGCGDSGGEGEQATFEQCLNDLSAAIEELKDTSGVSKVSLVGLRLGATFAALAASRRRDIDRVVLWDQVLDGGKYLEDLRELHGSWLRDRLGSKAVVDPERAELLGFPVTDVLRTQLTGVTLSPAPALRVKGVWVMVSEDQPDYQALRWSLEALALPTGYSVVPGEGEWNRPDMVHQTLLPHAMVKAITAALAS